MMTATTLPQVHRPETTRPITLDVARSEWTKLRSVRSTYWTFAAAIVSMVGIGAIFALIFANNYSGMSAAEKAIFNPTSVSLDGYLFAQLAIGVLGAIVVTSEYATGMIRTTFMAVPNRRLVLVVKAALFAGITAVIGVVSSFAAFFIGQAILSGQAPTASISDPGVLRSVVGAGLYLAVLGLLALGLGVLIRRTAGAIAAVFGILLVLPVAVSALGSSFDTVSKFLPSIAGQALFHTAQPGQHLPLLSPWTGFAVFGAYALATLAAGAVVVTRRDA
jgi:ABC-2 type transport system permease protein